MTASTTVSRAAGARGRRPVRRRTTPGKKPPGKKTTSGQKATGGKKRPGGRSRRQAPRWWPALVLAFLVVLGLAWRAETQDAALRTAERCTVPGSSLGLTGEQVANARTIAQVGYDRGLPERAVVIALATAMQESRLRNLDYGDRDSLGLFQQRPSMGWGTPAQVRDPAYAAGKFYDRLVQVPNWQTRRLTEAADAVQRSAFPEYYQKHEPLASALTAALAADDGITCG